jgi:hypothetical protein
LLLELDAAWCERGRAGPRLRGAVARTTAERLAGACTYAVGPVRASYLGVRNPALVFEGITIEPAQG